MSKRHGMREQKKLAAKNAKQEARRRQRALRQSADSTVRLKAADHWPIVSVLVPENLWSSGIGNLLIARRMPDDRLAIAAFLVDVFCLGVKNAFWKILAPESSIPCGTISNGWASSDRSRPTTSRSWCIRQWTMRSRWVFAPTAISKTHN